MKKLLILFLVSFVVEVQAEEQVPSVPSAEAATQRVETIVCIRHGEKPQGGLGQLNNKGLNRALALPDVLLKRYGTPGFIFAPNPTQKSDGNKYYYVRPLITIEPTAIRCGLPVNTQFGYKEIKGLESELQKPQYQNATIFVAWEHVLLDDFVKNVVKSNGGDPKQVPPWPSKDFDSVFLVKIIHDHGQVSVSFVVEHEGLDHLSEDYPKVQQ